MKKVLGFGLLALSSMMVQAAPAYYPVNYNELTIRMDMEGKITEVMNGTNVLIPRDSIYTHKSATGNYEIRLDGIMPSDHDYNLTTVQCSANTPDSALVGYENVGCFQVNGKPWIKVLSKIWQQDWMYDKDAITTTTIKWADQESVKHYQ